MKRIFAVITLASALVAAIVFTLAAAKPAHAQYPPICHDEMVCTPVYGCRWVTICR
jgi:hypothetical protein